MVTREVGRDWALTISGRDDERKKERERENFRNRPHRFIVDRRRRGASLIFNSTERERERRRAVANANTRSRKRKPFDFISSFSNIGRKKGQSSKKKLGKNFIEIRYNHKN